MSNIQSTSPALVTACSRSGTKFWVQCRYGRLHGHRTAHTHAYLASNHAVGLYSPHTLCVYAWCMYVCFDAITTIMDYLPPVQPGIRRYNMDWDQFEEVPSQTAPFACPTGAVLTPATHAQLKSLGYFAFHCYAEGT